MTLDHLDVAAARLILNTSQGFGAQSPKSQARVRHGKLQPSRAAHPLQEHLRGVGPPGHADRQVAEYKTKFCSLDDMASALVSLLHTPAGTQAIARLRPGGRESIRDAIGASIAIEVVVQGPPEQRVKFTPSELTAAAILRTVCVAVVEGRERAGKAYLQVQTFYPALDANAVSRLFDNRTPR